MSGVAQTFSKAFSVPFSELTRWDPNSFHRIRWHWPPGVMTPIGSVLAPRKEKVNRSDNRFSDLMPITIHFDGSIEPRKVSEDKEYSMELFWARPGDIVVSKIDLKNGAVGIIPDDWDKAVVTNHFAVYEPDLDRLDPKYFHLLIQAKFFKEYLWRNKVGAEGRKEVKLEFFESLEVPIPPLHVQQKIVAYWEDVQSRIIVAARTIETIQQETEKELLKKIGLQVPPVTPRRGHFTINYSQNERLDTFFFREDFICLDEQIRSFDYTTLGDALNFINRRWKRSDFQNGRFEYIEISSVTKNDGVTNTRRVSVGDAPSRATSLVKAGDIILSTTRPYLGAFAIIQEKHDGFVCSSGFSLADSLKTTALKKEFILFFLKSPAGLRQLERRMSGGLYPAIVQSELEKILIPTPTLKIQKEVVAAYKKGLEEIHRLRKESEEIKAQAVARIEQMILGTIPVEAN